MTVNRRWVLSRWAVGTGLCVVPAVGGALLIEKRPAHSRQTAMQAEYAQGMGATDSDGLVREFSLSLDGRARRMFVNSDEGDDANNGWSPHSGFKPNGTGPFRQHGATGKGEPSMGWGPKRTTASAEKALPSLRADAGDLGVGHQLLLAEGGIYPDATVAAYGRGSRAAFHYGENVAYPYVVQSYDPADPWNSRAMGRAIGPRRPEIRLSTDRSWNFNSNVNSVNGAASNFAFRGLRFTAPDGSRHGAGLIAFNWSNIDSDNILVENCDLGPCTMVFDNTSEAVAGKARWSRNLVVRRCLIDHSQSPGTLFPALHTSGWIGVAIEDCVWNHATWADTVEGRYLPTAEGGASIFTHDIYNAGASQSPNIVRRCVSLDAAATFLSNRNNVEAYNNVVIDAPISGGAGGGVANIGLEQPNGNYFDIHHNLSMGGGFIQGPKIVLAEQPTAHQTFIGVGGAEFEFVAPRSVSTTGRPSIVIGADIVATARNIADALNAHDGVIISRVAYRMDIGTDGPEIRQIPKSSGTPLVQVGSQGPGIVTPDPLFRSFAFGSTNGVAASVVRENLAINSGFTSTKSNMIPGTATGIGDGAIGRTSYANFRHNSFMGWGPNSESMPAPRGTVASFEGNSYTDVSPMTNDEIYRALGFNGKEEFRSAIVARFEQPWAFKILELVGARVGFDFAVAPVAPTQVFKHQASTAAPRVGELVEFPDPETKGGRIVSATTYVDKVPIAGTGPTITSFTPADNQRGKRISRMVVVAPLDGGPSTTVVTEIPKLIA